MKYDVISKSSTKTDFTLRMIITVRKVRLSLDYKTIYEVKCGKNYYRGIKYRLVTIVTENHVIFIRF